jgi:hypothetical protein
MEFLIFFRCVQWRHVDRSAREIELNFSHGIESLWMEKLDGTISRARVKHAEVWRV